MRRVVRMRMVRMVRMMRRIEARAYSLLVDASLLYNPHNNGVFQHHPLINLFIHYIIKH